MVGVRWTTILVAAAGCLAGASIDAQTMSSQNTRVRLRKRRIKYGNGIEQQYKNKATREMDMTIEDVTFWTRTLKMDMSYPPLPPPKPSTPPTTPAPIEPAPTTASPITPVPATDPPTVVTPVTTPPIVSTLVPTIGNTVVSPPPIATTPVPSIVTTPVPIATTPVPIVTTPVPSSLPTFEPTLLPNSLAPISLPPTQNTVAPTISTPSPIASTVSPTILTTTLQPSFPPTPDPTTMAPTLTPSASPTQPCNLTPQERADEIRELMSTISDPVLFDNPATPQAQALNWITNEDAIVPTLCPNIDDQLGCVGMGMNSMVQRYVLALFYYATNGDTWAQCSAPDDVNDPASVAAANEACNRVVTSFGVDNERVGDLSSDAWLGPVNECEWGGVACWGADTPNLNLCLDQLDFENDGLSGVLAPELSVLPSLRFLILEQGSISGSIPPEYGDLERLLIIDLDFNLLTGTLPESIYGLSALQQLDLNDNQLSGTLSTAIGDLSSLTFLQIDNNQFTSTIPSTMGQLSGLSKYIVFH